MSEKLKSKYTSLIIGLTGGIGSGKTTVSNMFAELGVTIVDADEISRNLLTPNSVASNKVINHFGQDILLANGVLNRAMLRTIIFTNTEKKHWLEELLHPLIRAEIHQQIEQASSIYTILSAPLLLESKHYNFVDRILVVDAPLEQQISRTVQRDSSKASEVNAIIATQISREHRLEQADDIIKNNSSLQQLEKQILMLHQYYLGLVKNN